ncbi:MAG TPA: AAA family ATPase, partial [Dehalococcoidia bacterium]
YPHPVDGVRLIQTHISFVFLAGEYVYKVKKPVDFGFLNFTTLRRRRYYCRREVELNTPLAPGVYLGVARIARGRDGTVRVGGPGRTVEYAVWMRRLPADRFLDVLAREGRVAPEELDGLAERLAAFHAAAPTGRGVDRHGRSRAVRANWEENFAQCEPYAGRTLTAEQLAAVRRQVRRFLTAARPLLEARVREGRVREYHGDLRGDCICLTDPPVIIDRIEFNRRFRCGDVASEVAFLAMDLEYQGRPDLARRFVERYARAADDPLCLLLVDFYRSYRAWVRGKVESFTLDEPEVEPDARAAAGERARRYFDLAVRSAERALPRPFLLVTCGLVGTGKSTLAAAVAEPLGALLVRSDVVRKELAGLPPRAGEPVPWGRGLYGPELTERTYAQMLARAGAALAAGRPAVLDATFSQPDQRAAARALAARHGVPFLCVHATLAEAEVRRRLEARAADPANVSDARWETYLAQRERFRPPVELAPQEVVTVDTGRPVREVRDAVLWALVPRITQGGR